MAPQEAFGISNLVWQVVTGWFAYTSLGEWFRFRTYRDVVLCVPNFYVTLSLELLQVLMMRIFTTQSWPVGWAGKPVKMGRNNLWHRSSLNRYGLSNSLLQMRSKNKSSVLSFIISVYVRSFKKRRTKQKLRNPLANRCLASIQCSSNYTIESYQPHTHTPHDCPYPAVAARSSNLSYLT